MQKTLLVTGGAGFIGSQFVKLMVNKYPHYRIVNIDALTYAGSLRNIEELSNINNYIFHRVDIRVKEAVQQLFEAYPITAVVHFAAESHVDRSILNSSQFISTNVGGTQVLLDTALQHWKLHKEDLLSRAFKEGVKFVHISTDEVYGSLGSTGQFNETMPLLPNNPYSASKAASDLLVRAYHETYGLPINITRCSNNYGPNQHAEKLIPTIISRATNNIPVPIYGDGQQVRDWLHVYDHCTAIDTVLHQGQSGEIYNIGGSNEKTNSEVVKLILKQLGKSESLITRVADRPGHDRRYAIDSTKLMKALGWKPIKSFEQGLAETVNWYIQHKDWLAT